MQPSSNTIAKIEATLFEPESNFIYHIKKDFLTFFKFTKDTRANTKYPSNSILNIRLKNKILSSFSYNFLNQLLFLPIALIISARSAIGI